MEGKREGEFFLCPSNTPFPIQRTNNLLQRLHTAISTCLTQKRTGRRFMLLIQRKTGCSLLLPLLITCRGLVAVSALVSGQTVRRRAAKTNPEEPKEVYSFYMFLWKIFYTSYLLLPLAR